MVKVKNNNGISINSWTHVVPTLALRMFYYVKLYQWLPAPVLVYLLKLVILNSSFVDEKIMEFLIFFPHNPPHHLACLYNLFWEYWHMNQSMTLGYMVVHGFYTTPACQTTEKKKWRNRFYFEPCHDSNIFITFNIYRYEGLFYIQMEM